MVKIADILSFLDNEGIAYEFQGRADTPVEGFSSLSQYVAGSMTWIKSEKNIPQHFNADSITLAIVQKDIDVSAQNVISTSESKRTFFSAIEKFFGETEERADIGCGTYIGPNVIIGTNAKIGHNCTLDGNITIGENTIIWDNITILNRVEIGKNCVIQSGTRIGHDGYGHTEKQDGTKTMVKHYGGVSIGDDVFIGPNCNIYRGTIDNTVIKNGCKVDGMCQLGHNVVLNENVSVIAGTIFYGSVTIEENAHLATCAIKNQVTVGKGSLIGMGSVVIKDVPPNTTVVGVPARPLVKEKK